jgi:hypothetical protein
VFTNSITRGLTGVGEPNLAVCLLPGTEVAFENDIEFEGGLGFFLDWKPAKRTGERVARFRQVYMDKPHLHHDALEFPNAEFVLLTRLCEGQFATVLQLPVTPRNTQESKQGKGTAAVD